MTIFYRALLAALAAVALHASAQTVLIDSKVQNVTGAKTFSKDKLCVGGLTSGSVCFRTASIAGSGTLDIGTGGTLGTAAYTAATAYEVPLTFAARLSRSTNTIDLANSGVTAGSCTNCDLTIDAYGRVTVKGNGSGGSSSLTSTYVGYGSGAGALTGTSDFAYDTANGRMTVAKSVAGTMRQVFQNTNSGTSSDSAVWILNDGGEIVALGKYSSGLSTSGLSAASMAHLTNQSGALLHTNVDPADFIWSRNGASASNEVMRLGLGTLSLGVAGTTTGSLALKGSTSGSSTITVGATGGLKLSQLTSNGYVSTSGSDGTLSVSTTIPATDLTGTIAAARMPAHTGDVTTSAGSIATTLATVNSNVGSFTNANITVNAKGLVTAAANGSGGTAKTFNGRLTLESGVPISTTDQTGKTTVYWTPYKGNQISLYDGSSTWNTRTFSQFSVSLGTLVSDTLYDLYVYDNAGTPTFRAPVRWNSATASSVTGATNATPIVLSLNGTMPANGDTIYVSGVRGNTAANGTWIVASSSSPNVTLTGSVGNGAYTNGGLVSSRAAANLPILQDGVYVKTGATTDLYVGTFYTTATTTTEQSEANGYLWNNYNRVQNSLFKTSSVSHTYATNAYRYWNASSANQINFIAGLQEDPALITVSAVAAQNASAGEFGTVIGWDGGNGNDRSVSVGQSITGTVSFAYSQAGNAALFKVSPGKHAAAIQELSASGSNSFFGYSASVQMPY